MALTRRAFLALAAAVPVFASELSTPKAQAAVVDPMHVYDAASYDSAVFG